HAPPLVESVHKCYNHQHSEQTDDLVALTLDLAVQNYIRQQRTKRASLGSAFRCLMYNVAYQYARF
ncbi:hypothetical protein JW935_26775, partial [candidate division KSB1 bacterium]|nr:hypothetical protein [candidate division KSB1 bacterium]